MSVELASYKSFNELSELLRKKGFQNDQSSGAPICRWIYQGETVDIMPDDEDIIYILNSCPDFMDHFKNETDEALKQYLKEKMEALISRSNIMKEIECALPIGEDNRADYIFEVIEEFAQS